MSFTLVLGGARSGKSRHAEQLIEAHAAPWTYIATAQAWDDEMRERISLHRARRPQGWTTVDAPIALPDAIRNAETGQAILVDCLTLWLTNVMPDNALARRFRDELGTLNQALAREAAHVVLTVAGLPLKVK